MAIERISIDIKSNAKNIESELKDIDNRIKQLKNNKPQLEIKAEKLQNAKKEINNVNVQLKELAAKKAMIKADSSNVVDAKKKIAEINTQMDKLRARKATLQVTAEKLKGADTQLSKLNREMNTLNNKKAKLQVDSAQVQVAAAQLDTLRNKFRSLETAGQGMVNFGRSLNRYVTLPLIAATAATANAAIKWEDNFAGVTKTNDEVVDSTGKIIYGYEQLEKDLRDLALEIPLSNSHEEIAKIAENAGQLGIATENVKAFSKVMADLGVTTNMTAETASTELARFANITGLDPGNYDRLGSTIVDLGNKFATTESEISAMSLRLSGAGTVVGMSEADIMGLSAALSSVGIKSEMGGSAISKLMVNMQLASAKGQDAFSGLQVIAERNGIAWSSVEQAVASGGKELTNMSNALGLGKKGLSELYKSADDARSSLEDFAWIAGMTGDEFAQAFEKDAVGAISAFVDGLSHAEDRGTTAIEMLDQMGIKEVRLRDALLRAGGASELFANAIKTSNTAWEENTALTNEAEKRYNTTASQLNLLKAEVRDIAIDLGGPLIEAIRGLLTSLKPTLKNIAEMAKKFNKADDSTKKLAGAILGITVAIGPAFTLTGKFTTVIGKLGQIMLKSQSSAAAAAGGFSSLGSAAAAAGGGGGIGAFTAALSPLGVALLGIVGVGGTLALGYGAWKTFGEEAYNSGERVKRWGTDVGEAVDQTLVKVKETTQEATGKFGLMAQGFNTDSGQMAEDFAMIGATIEESLVKKIEGLDSLLKNLPGTVSGSMQEIVEGEKSRTESALETIEANNKRIKDIRENAEKSNREISVAETKMISDLSKSTAEAYVNTLDVSAEQRRSILKSMTGDVATATKEEATLWMQSLGEQRNASQNHSAQLRKEQEQWLKDWGYNLEGEFAQSYLSEWDKMNRATTDGFDSQIAAIVDKYPELANEVHAATGKLIKDAVGANQYLIEDNERLLQSAGYTANTMAENARKNAKEIAWTADESKKAGQTWNSIVLDEKTFEVKSNAREAVIEAAKTSSTWNEMKFLIHDTDLDSNAKKVIGEAAVANGRWDSLVWDEKKAILQDDFSISMYKTLENAGEWEKLELNQKYAFLQSNTQEVMAQTMFELGIWDEYKTEIKKLDAENYNFLSILAGSEEKLAIWNAEDPEVKKIIGDDYEFLTTIYSSEETLAQWNGLSVTDKKLLADNTGLLTIIGNSEQSYNRWLQLPDADKKLLADNTDLLQKIINSDKELADWNALKVDEKKLKASDSSFNITLGNADKRFTEFNDKKFNPKDIKVEDLATTVLNNIKNTMDGIQDKNVTVKVNYTSSGDPWTGGEGGRQFSTGGEVTQYRAVGGDILGNVFKPKGTDTVPAMLTPGEFVQRKAAVNKFGVDFMNKVNNLDVSGAFKAMTGRFGTQHALQTASVSTVVNNINQTTNNANKVTQHVTGGNPDYIMKRAGRYLR